MMCIPQYSTSKHVLVMSCNKKSQTGSEVSANLYLAKIAAFN